MMKQYCLRIKHIGQQGVTLVELLLVMGLLSIFMVMLSGILAASLDVQSQSQSYATVNHDSRFMLARLEYDLNHASAVTMPVTYNASSSSLGIVIGGVTYTYSLNGTNVQLSDGTNTDVLNGGDTTVSGLSFIKYGNAGGKPLVKVNFTLTSKIPHDDVYDTQTYITTVGLR